MLGKKKFYNVDEVLCYLSFLRGKYVTFKVCSSCGNSFCYIRGILEFSNNISGIGSYINIDESYIFLDNFDGASYVLDYHDNSDTGHQIYIRKVEMTNGERGR